jgi:hypothetical protein
MILGWRGLVRHVEHVEPWGLHPPEDVGEAPTSRAGSGTCTNLDSQCRAIRLQPWRNLSGFPGRPLAAGFAWHGRRVILEPPK